MFCNEDKFVIFAGTENNLQILDLTTLQVRTKIDMKDVIYYINIGGYLNYYAFNQSMDCLFG